MVPVHKVPENISVSTLFDMFIRMKMHLLLFKMSMVKQVEL